MSDVCTHIQPNIIRLDFLFFNCDIPNDHWYCMCTVTVLYRIFSVTDDNQWLLDCVSISETLCTCWTWLRFVNYGRESLFIFPNVSLFSDHANIKHSLYIQVYCLCTEPKQLKANRGEVCFNIIEPDQNQIYTFGYLELRWSLL